MKKCFVLLVLLFGTYANAATIYVDHLISGSCSNYNVSTRACSGGALTAYETINAAENVGGAGVTIEIREGTYTECISLNHSGASGSPFIIRAYNPGTGYEDVIIAADGSCSGTGNAIIDMHTFGTYNYVEIYGVEVTGEGQSGIDNCIWLKGTHNGVYDSHLHHCGYLSLGSGDTCLQAVQASNTTIARNEIHHCGWNGISIESADNFLVEDNYVHDVTNHAAMNAFPQSQSNYDVDDYMEEDNIIRNNIFSEGTSCVYLQWQRRLQFYNNLVYINVNNKHILGFISNIYN
jgi:parallel beta-helix repeat protein